MARLLLSVIQVFEIIKKSNSLISADMSVPSYDYFKYISYI